MNIEDSGNQYRLNFIYNHVYFRLYSVMFFVLFLIMDSQLNSVLNTRTTKSFILILCILFNLYIMAYNKKSIIYYMEMSLSVLLLTIPFFFSDAALISTPVFVISLFLFNSYNLSSDKLVKVDLEMRICFCLVVISCYFFHLFPSSTYTTIAVRDGVLRYALGFNSGNSLAMFIYTIIISFILLNKEKIFKIKNCLILLVFVYFIFRLTDSREFFILGLITFLFMLLGKYKIISSIIHYMVPISLFVSIYVGLIFLLSNNLSHLYYLNVLTSNRIAIQFQAIMYYPIRLMGYSGVELLDVYKLNIDNMYVAYLVHYGVIGFTFLSYLFIKAYFISRKVKSVFVDFSMIIIPASLITLNADYVLFILIYTYSLKNFKGDKHELI